MSQPQVLVLRAPGTNCDEETALAFEQAGAKAQRVHINRLLEKPTLFQQFQILCIPGGFSYGDDVAAGKIMANQAVHHLSEALRKFINDGKLVLGICNGFQVLVKMGILPGFKSNLATEDTENTEINKKDQRPEANLVTITNNDCGKFEDRWVYLSPQTKKCIFIEQDRQIYLPIAHGEGKVVTKDDATLEQLKSGGHIAFKYVDENGKEGGFPINPNGSVDSIAGLTDTTGRVLGLMPHPERFVRPTQHPRWTRLKDKIDADGMTIFHNAVKYIQENF